MQSRDLKEFLGKTMASVVRREVDRRDGLEFTTVDGERLAMYHRQSCCEIVRIEDIAGELDDLIGTPVLAAYVSWNNARRSDDLDDDEYENTPPSQTWSFYHFATMKGAVTIRWHGESNGCYSETADVHKWDEAEEEWVECWA